MASILFDQLNDSELRTLAQMWTKDLYLQIGKDHSWKWSAELWEGFTPESWEAITKELSAESGIKLEAFLQEDSLDSVVLHFDRKSHCQIFELQQCDLGEKGKIYRWNAHLQSEDFKQLLMDQTHDHLTQLYNRAFFETELKRLDLGRTFPVSVICMDLASLRPVNAALGSEVGDQYLLRASDVLRQTFRREDIVCRINGGEFAALLPNTGAEGAQIALARLKGNVSQCNEIESDYEIQFSLGLSSVETPGRLKEAFAEADRRMQAEKTARKFKRGF